MRLLKCGTSSVSPRHSLFRLFLVVHLPRAVYPPSPPKRTQMPMSGRQMAP